jgi:hypothetical protein
MRWILALSLALALAGVLYQWLAGLRDLHRLRAPGTLVDVGEGRRLHLQCQGSGTPTVVLEAGIAASSLSWSRVQPRVAEFTRACSYDRTGLAWSDAAGQPLGAGRLADQLHALLAAAAVPPPYVLVGHSFGGPSWSSTRSARSSTALEDSTRSSPE